MIAAMAKLLTGLIAAMAKLLTGLIIAGDCVQARAMFGICA
jgi:hypothetical protein